MLHHLIVISFVFLAANALVSQTTCNNRQYTYLELAGFGDYPSDARDFLGDTVGGVGSAIAIDRTSWKKSTDGTYTGTLWAVGGRGWTQNGTVDYWTRIHQFNIQFKPLPPRPTPVGADPPPPNLVFTYVKAILLFGPRGDLLSNPITGLEPDRKGHLSVPGFPNLPFATYPGDNFFSGVPVGTKVVSIDPEGLVVNKDGSFWISDRYGPFVYQFDGTGKMIAAIRPPDAFIPMRNGTESFSSDTPPINSGLDHDVFPPDNPTGRHNKRGFDGLTVSDDSDTLWVMLKSALNQEGGLSRATERYVRLLEYDIKRPRSPTYKHEYVISLPLYKDPSDGKTKTAAQSEILHVQDKQFFVLARDSDAETERPTLTFTSTIRRIDIFDLDGATDIKGPTHDCSTCAIASPSGVLKSGIRAASYCPFLDFNVKSQLERFGLVAGLQNQGLSKKWESLAAVPVDGRRGEDGEWFVFSLNDNEYTTQNGFMDFGQTTYRDATGFSIVTKALVFKIKLQKGGHAFS